LKVVPVFSMAQATLRRRSATDRRDGARSAATPSQMMAECSERLVQAGLPLWRVGVFVRTLHPEIIGWSFIWKPGEEVHVGTVARRADRGSKGAAQLIAQRKMGECGLALHLGLDPYKVVNWDVNVGTGPAFFLSAR
jgi:hypothetical protein